MVAVSPPHRRRLPDCIGENRFPSHGAGAPGAGSPDSRRSDSSRPDDRLSGRVRSRVGVIAALMPIALGPRHTQLAPPGDRLALQALATSAEGSAHFGQRHMCTSKRLETLPSFETFFRFDTFNTDRTPLAVRCGRQNDWIWQASTICALSAGLDRRRRASRNRRRVGRRCG